ncbi:hypothetical protein EO98_17715 [Methanosarcina sp. 2.H.T.1A.6]|nr:hypothetical protein EO97_11015 [Methanosarcina sp. 2.H.T.1A.15]KKG14629.1 hypothetical protein EO94_01540 [Methanosarcina sp. 2.H.T.1A.3]KKG24584.1 hypothetical protein EO98_17715 [Methanosarcina sp. 2.H.T.1A.6]KKG25815.1 hypothetical protein EO96_19505 [Methanosarcina sp. 2.H.T.1A.8]
MAVCWNLPGILLQIFGEIENLLPFAALERVVSSPISFALHISVPSRLFTSYIGSLKAIF